jgi:hypothetical protein
MPAATVPPMVAPASISGGSNGRYCPCAFSVSSISRNGVPAQAVNTHSSAEYSVMPRSVDKSSVATPLSSGDAWVALVPPPRTRSAATLRTASCI